MTAPFDRQRTRLRRLSVILTAEMSPIEGFCGSSSVVRRRAKLLFGNYNYYTIHLVTVTGISELDASPNSEQ